MRILLMNCLLALLIPFSAWSKPLQPHIGFAGKFGGISSNLSYQDGDGIWVQNYNGTGYAFEIGSSSGKWQGYFAYGIDHYTADRYSYLYAPDDWESMRVMTDTFKRQHYSLGVRYHFVLDPKNPLRIYMLVGGFLSYGTSARTYIFQWVDRDPPPIHPHYAAGSGWVQSSDWGGGGEFGFWIPVISKVTALLTTRLEWHGLTTPLTPAGDQKAHSRIADLSVNLGLQYRIALRES